jgi:hypothetical protein
MVGVGSAGGAEDWRRFFSMRGPRRKSVSKRMAAAKKSAGGSPFSTGQEVSLGAKALFLKGTKLEYL